MKLGIHTLLEALPTQLEGARVGLLAHPASVAQVGGHLRHTVTLLHEHPDLRLTRLFGPEHGLYGRAQEGEAVGDSRDPKTGLEVVSLYGARRAPVAEHLRDLDALIFDLQDVGVRCFTYLATLKECLTVCAAAGLVLVVLDRPNPLGRAVYGPGLREGYASFVGAADVPFVHGLTLGELALTLAAELGLTPFLQVVPLAGWQGEPWETTGLPWVPPSPNLPRLESAKLYPATVFFEGSNVSEGRGSERPFEQIGAPWLNGERLAETLNALELPGVSFAPARFTPSRSKHAGQEVAGVRLKLSGAPFDPLELGWWLLCTCRAQQPERFSWLLGSDGRAFTDLLYGSSALRVSVSEGCALPPEPPSARLTGLRLYGPV